jgi:hypothetical protein
LCTWLYYVNIETNMSCSICYLNATLLIPSALFLCIVDSHHCIMHWVIKMMLHSVKVINHEIVICQNHWCLFFVSY